MPPGDNTMPTPGPAKPGPQPAPGGAAGGDLTSSLQALAASGMFSGGGSNKPSTVYTGEYGPQTPTKAGADVGITQNDRRSPFLMSTQQKWSPVTEDIQSTINRFYQMNDQQKMDLRQKLSLIDKSALTASDADIAKIWGDYAQQAANYFSAGQNVTPWDILAKDISSRGGAASLAGTKTSTTSDTNLTSRIDSDAIFRSAAQSLLGRDPTDQENAKFQQMLNSQEQANPTTATISTTTDDQGKIISQNRVSQGGVTSAGAAELARRQAIANPEHGAYEAATTYFNALRGVLGM